MGLLQFKCLTSLGLSRTGMTLFEMSSKRCQMKTLPVLDQLPLLSDLSLAINCLDHPPLLLIRQKRLECSNVIINFEWASWCLNVTRSMVITSAMDLWTKVFPIALAHVQFALLTTEWQRKKTSKKSVVTKSLDHHPYFKWFRRCVFFWVGQRRVSIKVVLG